MNIRTANLDDLTKIANLHAQSWRENYREALSNNYLENQVFADREKVWSERLNMPMDNQLVLVAELSGVFRGFICAFGAHHVEYGSIIDNLHVVNRYKGQGIGTQLLASAAKWANENYPNDKLYLEVLACNTKAYGFYQSIGAKEVSIAYWNTPCNNRVKEYLLGWESPGVLANKVSVNVR